MATTTRAALRDATLARRSHGVWYDAFARLRKNKLAMVGLLIVILLIILGVVGPALAPWHYGAEDVAALKTNNYFPLLPFSPLAMQTAHYLGTDEQGHDLLSRLMDGAQISMTVALVVQVVVLVIGVPVGAIAGWFGGRADNLLMRFTDVMYAFPDLLFIILMSITFRQTEFGHALNGLLLIFIAIGLTAWVTVARLVRGQLLQLKEMEFVEAARAIGVSDRNIIIRHLLPNSLGPVIVAVTLGIPGAILAEATLSFLGIGIQPPRASWGSLINAGVRYISTFPHLVLLPAILIALALISFTFLGDGLRDALDPKLKGKQ